ncbi:hypothetical protein BR93DRAFT_998226 [Coniochaeta sp. PMI_546]|nr:hypothetical protein BR93DRAFT_998226 [Coniochaeta sp. PMI_546]
MSAEQVKYVRHRYRENPDFRRAASHSHVNDNGNQQATKAEVEAVVQSPLRPAFQPSVQPFSLTATAASRDSQNFGSHSDDHSDEHTANSSKHVNNDMSERVHRSPPTPEVNGPVRTITFRAQPIVWLEGPHEGCPFQGTHHHEADGGVTFPSVAALMDMVRRMKEPSFSLAGLADAMERIEREEAEAKAAAATNSQAGPSA